MKELVRSDFKGSYFESYSKENGFTHWSARDLMFILGYDSWQSFKSVINKAMSALTHLNVLVSDHIVQIKISTERQREAEDFKLSRFACYFISVSADEKKPAVVKVRAYLAGLAETIQNHIEQAEKVERINVRGELSEREKSLSGVVRAAKVENYGLFQNAGYRGLYNKNIKELKKLKGVEGKRSPLDFMGKDELAANLFRITQTELKIKQERIRGQGPLEATAETVGQQVRKTMKEISGVLPEDLPVCEDIRLVKRHMKEVGKKLKRLDKPK